MGQSIGATCIECGCQFTVNYGGGWAFHLLHCEKCGAEKNVPHDELGEFHERYMARWGSVADTVEDDEESMTDEQYDAAVEEHAGKCTCGGSFGLRARPRCPDCGSANFVEEPERHRILYD